MSGEQKQKLSNFHIGKSLSVGAKQKLSEYWQGENNPNVKNPKFGSDNPFFGKHHSDETKQIMGQKLSQKYKCPFCDYVSNHGGVTKHIKKVHYDLLESATTIENICYEKYITE